MDSVRGLAYFDTEQILASVSEDCLVKLWDIKDIKKNFNAEAIEPYFTLRGHTAPVFAICKNNGLSKEKYIYTAGEEGQIRVWEVPLSSQILPYGKTEGRNFCIGVWKGHTETIWDLAFHPTNVFSHQYITQNLGSFGLCRL
jgi:striatin 1/3/4